MKLPRKRYVLAAIAACLAVSAIVFLREDIVGEPHVSFVSVGNSENNDRRLRDFIAVNKISGAMFVVSQDELTLYVPIRQASLPDRHATSKLLLEFLNSNHVTGYKLGTWFLTEK